MKLILYPRSSTRTRRAFIKIKKKFGHRHYYFPRWIIIERWCRELNWTSDQVIDQFYKERKFLVKYVWGVDITH